MLGWEHGMLGVAVLLAGGTTHSVRRPTLRRRGN
jgi:hypothetical protein